MPNKISIKIKGGKKTGKILDKKQVAELLGISWVLVDKLRKEGLPYHKLGKLIKFDEDEVLEWFRTRTNK